MLEKGRVVVVERKHEAKSLQSPIASRTKCNRAVGTLPRLGDLNAAAAFYQRGERLAAKAPASIAGAARRKSKRERPVRDYFGDPIIRSR